MNFQRIVLVIAIVLLIVCLVLIGIVLVNSKSAQQWPPMIGDCPDYWIDTSGNGANCVGINNNNIGKYKTVPPTTPTMDFSQSPFVGSNGLCAKYNWATNKQVSWDGITYGVPNPCDTPAPTK